MTDLIGRRYQLLNRLGEGGMGVVYRALDRLTGDLLALKSVVHLPLVMDEHNTLDARLVLAQEFRLLAALRHPNIISVLDYGFDAPGRPYYTMELLPSPHDILTVSRLRDTRGRVLLLLELLQALVYLHQHGLIHRDLKPGNVLVDAGRRLKVLDFGLATTRQGVRGVVGTMAYIAPEVLRQQPASAAADLYAVGIIAYEMFMGRHPFETGSTAHLIASTIGKMPEAPPLIASAGPEIAGIILRLLAKDPADRYPDAASVIDALCQALHLPPLPETRTIRESFLHSAPFIGREPQLATLEQALTQMQEGGTGSAWLLAGESGAGKSRLMEELRIRALVRGILVLSGRGTVHGSRPFELWYEVVRRLLAFVQISDAEASILKGVVPEIASFIGREVPDAPQLSDEETAIRLALTISGIFLQLHMPILLLADDLHWLASSLEPLRYLIRLLDTLPLMIVGSYRSDEYPYLYGQLPQMPVLPVPRLDQAQVADLVTRLVPGREHPAPELMQFVYQQSEGVPLFVVEVVRTLADHTGRLAEVARMTLPERLFTGGLATLALRRLQQLAPADQDLLLRAALIGRVIDPRIMQAVRPGLEVEEWLMRCAGVALVTVDGDRWCFAHDKLRETLADNLLPEDRPAAYADIARAIETACPDPVDFTELLAVAWDEAGEPARALPWLLRASTDHIAYTQPARALPLLRRALALAEPAPASPLLAEVHLHLGHALRLAGDAGAAQEHFHRVVQLDIPALYPEAFIGLAMMARLTGQHDQAEAFSREALAIYQEAHDPAGRGRALLELGTGLVHHGAKLAEGAALLEEGRHLLTATGQPRALALLLCELGVARAMMDEAAAAEALFNESLALNESLNNLRGATQALANLGYGRFKRGDYAGALGCFERVLEIRLQLGDELGQMYTYSNLTACYLHLGRFEDCRRTLRQGLHKAVMRQSQPLLLYYLTWAAMLALEYDAPQQSAAWCGLALAHPVLLADNRRLLEAFLPQVQAALGAAGLAAGLAAGERLNLLSVAGELITTLPGENSAAV
jgi:tetratricopeptide (TPR) repeat protein